MAEFDTERKVVVERDATDRSSPVGLIVLVVALLALTFFLLLGGTRMFGGDTTNDTNTQTDDTNTQIDTPTTTPTPTPDSTPEETTPTPSPQQ
jgi:hypothetical protein